MPYPESDAQQPTYKAVPGMKLIDVLPTAAALKRVVARTPSSDRPISR